MTVKLEYRGYIDRNHIYNVIISDNITDPYNLTIADIVELSKLKRSNGFYIVDRDHIGRMVAEWCGNHWKIVGSEHNYDDDVMTVISGPIIIAYRKES